MITFIAAAGVSLIAANFLTTAVQDSSEIAVRRTLDSNDLGWAEVEADGLRVILAGTAPDEATRFRAVTMVGEVVDAARIIDTMEVAPTETIAPPRFSAEILRNNGGISIIGLIPAAVDRKALVGELAKIADPAPVSDLMETADYPVPERWDDALSFTVIALAKLPRSKISVDAGRIAITAIADSADAKRKLEQDLQHAAPPDLQISLEIAAPRPVIAPFTLRYIIDANGGRFDACSADTHDARARILAAAHAAGGIEGAPCEIGLGVPSPTWAEAAALGLGALSELGGGSVTFADGDVTLVAAEGTAPGAFDLVIGELETALPDAFTLHAVLPEPEQNGESGPPEFTATLSPEGLVQLRGRLNDENLQHMAESYAKARFGSSSVHLAARTASDLPMDWPVRVLAGIEALSHLSNGAVTVAPENLVVRGMSSREDASAEIARLLSERLGEAENYQLDIAYKAPPPPKEIARTPEMCEAEIAEAQRDYGKITFEPGSATIAAVSQDTMNAIAEILAECGEVKLEIQGHTDSQGRTSMNQQLSQDRAQSVLNELHARRILTASYTAKGYGEDQPIAPNETEEGREANRRIEIRLIRPEPVAEAVSTLEAVAQETTRAGDAEKAPADATESNQKETENGRD